MNIESGNFRSHRTDKNVRPKPLSEEILAIIEANKALFRLMEQSMFPEKIQSQTIPSTTTRQTPR